MKQQKGILFAIWIGLLSALSGFVNITTLLLYEKPTTHMTGNVSGVLIHAMSGETSHALTLLLIIISFLLGGVCCGMIFSEKVFRFANRYGILLIVLGLLLGISFWLNLEVLWIYQLAFTVGVQNGMFIYYRGMIVRTSHFTGYLTDTGFAIGRCLRGHRKDKIKIVFYSLSMLFFLFGGALAFEMATWSKELLLFVIMYLLVGIISYSVIYMHTIIYWRINHDRYFSCSGYAKRFCRWSLRNKRGSSDCS